MTARLESRGPTGPRLWRSVWLPAALCAFALLVFNGRLLWQARASVAQAQAAAARGDTAGAIASYRDALRAYVLGSPYQTRASDGLMGIADRAAAAGDAATERAALAELRAGLLAARSFFVPGRGTVPELDLRLARLLTTDEGGAGAADVLLQVHRPTEATIATQALFSLLALLGLAAWVGGVVLFIQRGVTRDARRTPSRLMRVLPSVLFVAGFVVFMIGLRLA